VTQLALPRRVGSRRRPVSKRARKIGLNLLGLLVALITLFPIFFMVSTSFKPSGEIETLNPHLLPSHPTLANYRAVLDGTAAGEGDRSRGARYNSALKYLSSAGGTPTVIMLVSEDGMINLLPDLRSRMHRADLDAILADLREAAAIDPVHAERFYKAYRRIEAAAFYLSPDQIDEVNALHADHWERRRAEGASIWVNTAPLRPDPEMTDEYLID